VYGKGGQTRGFIDIRDTVRCVELAALNAPEPGEYRVFNQFTEQFSVGELALRVQAARTAHGLATTIDHLPNPRTELETHYYNAKHQRLLDLGLQPHSLEDSLIDRVVGLVERHKKRIKPHLFAPRVDWRFGGRGDFKTPAAGRRTVATAPSISIHS
jgi:UDP-sulfoquinovose synthase